MTLREKIGQRITQARKLLGMTIKELAERTVTLSPARISNWEQGTRSPGPLEAKLLADQLQVSASYLLCLTDSPEGELIMNLQQGKGLRRVPFIDFSEAHHARQYIEQQGKKEASSSGNTHIILDCFNQTDMKAHVFATLVDDASMMPDFRERELLIVTIDREPKPGEFVLAFLLQKNHTVLRQYRESDDCLYQLHTSNHLWANISISAHEEACILGVVIEHRRYW